MNADTIEFLNTQLEHAIIHRRFANLKGLENVITDVLDADKKIKLTLSQDTDFEKEKFDYDFVGTLIKEDEEIADIYIWALYDRQKQLYITECEVVEV